jgi:outer membrane protein OmpA-like peptidoglycan-associated protein
MIKRHSQCSSRSSRCYVGSCAALAAALVFAPEARAQTATGFAVNRHEPAERGSEWFVTDSLDFRGNNRLRLGLTGDYSYRPLVIYAPNGDVRTAVVSHQLVLHLGASFLVLDRLRFGVNVPLQMYADGEGGTLNGVRYPPPSAGQSVGDIRLAADARLFGNYGDAATLAIGLRGWIPNGASTTYASDGEIRLSPQALLAGDIGAFVYAARAGFLFRSRSETFGDSPIGSELVYAASAGIRLLEKKNLVVGPEIFGSTVTKGFFEKHTSPVEALLGAHYSPSEEWRVGVGGGLGIGAGYGSPVARALASIEWTPRQAAKPTDRDGDGIHDDVDACPDTPGIPADDPKKNGCPAPKDTDGDGITDDIDACPTVRGVRSDDPKKNGCPAAVDTDKDGILDEEDACPTAGGPRTGDPKTNGCPDTDKDGIIDREDACPDKPGVKDADPKKNGCPLDPDRDKDGIPNDTDACPDEPGKSDPDPKKNGCPAAFVQAGQIKILEQVRFAPGSTAIVPGKESEAVLQAVLGVLNNHPEIKRIRIEGHTDDQGGAAYNKALSAGRAASVVAWLVKHGIDKNRLTSIGFGLEKPIGDNKTDEGRKLNRRVEFHIEEAP